jgi:thiamine monophosphate kinase
MFTDFTKSKKALIITVDLVGVGCHFLRRNATPGSVGLSTLAVGLRSLSDLRLAGITAIK